MAYIPWCFQGNRAFLLQGSARFGPGFGRGLFFCAEGLMDFTYFKDIIHDAEKRKATVDWAIDELQKDVTDNRGQIFCFCYGIAYKMDSKDGVRIAWMSKTGGADDFKPVLLMKMLEGIKESARKSGNYDLLRNLPWWRRLSFRLLMALPPL